MGLAAPYRQRHPERTAFYRCLQDYWEEFKDSYAYFYERDYGPWRPVVEKTVQRFLDCAIFHQGFARVRCDGCDSEYLLAFSCKTRYFCPSCQAKRLAAYILRPSFAATRLRYQPEDSQVEYRTAKGVTCSMDALDWIALVTSHIPAHHEHMLRYYGRYSNAARGKRWKNEAQAILSSITSEQETEQDSPAERFSRELRRSWARLLRKIYEVDPLTCRQCGSSMRILAFVEQPEVIRKILQHLNLWERPQRSPPPQLFSHKLEAFLASLSPRQAQQIRASTDSVFWDDVPTYPDF